MCYMQVAAHYHVLQIRHFTHTELLGMCCLANTETRHLVLRSQDMLKVMDLPQFHFALVGLQMLLIRKIRDAKSCALLKLRQECTFVQLT